MRQRTRDRAQACGDSAKASAQPGKGAFCGDRDFSISTDLSSSQKKKNDPWDMGRHSLVSKPRFINTKSGIFDTSNIA